MSSTQVNLLINVLDETTQLGNILMTELESVLRDGVWHTKISEKLRKVFNEYEWSCMKED